MFETLVKNTRKYLEDNCKDMNLPFINNFPNNCCEGVSLLLGKIITDEFPDKKIYFVKGTNSSKYEMHFWIEIGDRSFDITADQFKIATPFIDGKLADTIKSRFDSTEKMTIDEALRVNDFAINNFDEMTYISNIIRKIT